MPIEFTSDGVQKVSGQANAVPVKKPLTANTAESVALRQDLPSRTQVIASTTNLINRENFDDAIQKKVEHLISQVQNIQRDLHFSVDKESGRTVIRVIDRETRETIRTIPPEDFSVMAQMLEKNTGLLLRTSV